MKYDGDLYDYIKDRIENQLVFDIGANVGEMTKRFVSYGCKVVSVEPQVELTNNHNYDGTLSIKNACIDNKVGSTTFYKCTKNVSSSCRKDWRIHHPKLEWNELTLPTITIDSLIEEFGVPKYIKLDVEGYEHKAIEGLSSKVDLISLEYTDGFIDSTMKCIELLSRFGIMKIISFVKCKVKRMVKGKKETIEMYSILDEFNTSEGIGNFLNSLPKSSRKFQGDLLIIV